MTVTFDDPADDGGSPIRWFEYSTDGGTTWRVASTTSPEAGKYSFDVTSFSPDGDIKVELFGDGVSHAIPSVPRYTSTGYVVIFGGWQNSRNVIARMDEHAPDRVEGPRKRVVQGRSYHFEIVREGGLLTVSIDGEELMRMDDPAPLRGRGHDHFAFNNWNSDVLFDNLEISPL